MNEKYVNSCSSIITNLIVVCTITTIFVVLLIALYLSVQSSMSRQDEAAHLSELGVMHGVEPSRVALRDFLTQELQSRKGMKSEAIHSYLMTIGGESVTWVESPLQNRKVERVTWIMARATKDKVYFAEWILEYDDDDYLIRVELTFAS